MTANFAGFDWLTFDYNINFVLASGGSLLLRTLLAFLRFFVNRLPVSSRRTLNWTILSCVAIYFAWQMHVNGWFERIGRVLSWFGGMESDGFGGVSELAISIIPFMVDFVCTVGIIAISVYTMLWAAIKPLCVKLLRLLDAKLEEHGIDLIEFDDEKESK